ncbi:MAG: AmmeMemoRadiSam system protein B [Anaerolineae bacterium]|nr:AmmeMemoRadiSam system protein B [Anaerolineae bacterium]
MPHGTPSDARPSPLAGTWYPGRADRLKAMIDDFLESADAAKPPGHGGAVRGLLAPHAGLRYSGQVAAHAFDTVRGQTYDTVVVIGPLHRPIPGLTAAVRALTSGHDAYETPLGPVAIDREAVEAISARVPLQAVRGDPEHSIEIELPFLQHVLAPGFTLVPIMLLDQSKRMSAQLAETLAETLRGRRVLFVASSDLSHFYPQPVANELDSRMLGAVSDLDAPRVVDLDEQGVAFACGHGAIATVIEALKRMSAPQANVVRYATSGDVTGDYSQVVGYGAATFRDTPIRSG